MDVRHLIQIGLLQPSGPGTDQVPSVACAEEEEEEEVAVAITANRGGRAALAVQTLRVHTHGRYRHDSHCVNISPQLQYARDNTELYPAQAARAATRAETHQSSNFETCIEVTDETTIQAGSRLHAEIGTGASDAVCLLNFASAKNPGGGFQGGSLAQEESLALASGLYACLEPHMQDFYEVHRNDPADGLYSHAMMYSPRVPFFRDDTGDFCAVWCAGVVTSPAPNAGVARKRISEAEIGDVLKERCGRVLAVAQEHGHTHLVLGAFGCGVFKNDPSVVAMCFDYWLRGSGKFARAFDKVVFAIPFDVNNLPAFSSQFLGEPSQPRGWQTLDDNRRANATTDRRNPGGGSSRKNKRLQKLQGADDDF